MIDVRVDLDALRRALRSVLPHVGKGYPLLDRVRVYVTDGMELVVTASDRYTLGLASVEVLDTTGELGAFDLSPQDVRDVLAQFPVNRNDNDECEIRIRWDEKSFTFTDVTGLFDSEKELVLPAAPVDDKFPDLGQLVRHLRENYTVDGDVAHGHLNPTSPFMSVSGDYMSRFATVAKVQGCALVIEPVGRARTLLITCGPDFIGALMPVRQDEEKIEEYRGHRSAWSERYPTVAQVHPVPPKLPNRAEPSPTVIYLSQFDATIANEPDDNGAETDVEPETAVDGEIESYVMPFEIPESSHDPEFIAALQYVAETGSASRKALQKHLGATVAAVREVLQRLEAAGAVGPQPIGNEPREVFVYLDGTSQGGSTVMFRGGDSR